MKLNFSIFFIALFLICNTFNSLAQPNASLGTSDKKAIKYYQEAEQFLIVRKFDDAIILLDKAVKADSNFFEAHIKLGAAHRLLLHRTLAKKHFYKACTIRPNQRDLAGAYFIVAEYLTQDGQYAEAEIFCNKTIEYAKEMHLKAPAEKLLENIRFAQRQPMPKTTFRPQKVAPPINQYYMQSRAVTTADRQQLIFFKRNGTRPSDSEDIMISDKTDNGWSVPVSISDSINSPIYNEGMCSISGDGRTLVFASCRRPDAIENSCDIYLSYKRGDKWSQPINMGINVNSKAWDSEPCLSSDGHTLYFSSTRSGGLGKEDIWMCKKNNQGIWSKAVNVGEPVNSKGREVSPFIYANGSTLFFATDYRAGMGGFDLFYSQQNDSMKFETPINIGVPINTAENDISLFITADGKKCYYDILERTEGLTNYSASYIYEFDVPEQLTAILQPTVYYKGTVSDAITRNKIAAKIELIDLEKNQIVQQVYADEESGKYLIVLTAGKEYDLHVSHKSYLFHSEHINYKEAKLSDASTFDVKLMPIKRGSATTLRNIFFESGSAKLNDKSKSELDKLDVFLTDNPKITLQIAGHTDNIGTEADNQKLSQGRAESVKAYLTKKGIVTTRLKTIGFGSQNPTASNADEATRALNRRIEVVITSE